jgi:hypothetical protein
MTNDAFLNEVWVSKVPPHFFNFGTDLCFDVIQLQSAQPPPEKQDVSVLRTYCLHVGGRLSGQEVHYLFVELFRIGYPQHNSANTPTAADFYPALDCSQQLGTALANRLR